MEISGSGTETVCLNFSASFQIIVDSQNPGIIIETGGLSFEDTYY